MKTIGVSEAKTRFSELLGDIANGETVTVTRHGIPVAHIIPARRSFEDAATAIDEWRRYRRARNITLGEGVPIRELIEEGREQRMIGCFSTGKTR